MEGEIHVCENSFLSQLNHLKEQGLGRTSECKWDRIERCTTKRAGTKEGKDNRAETLLMRTEEHIFASLCAFFPSLRPIKAALMNTGGKCARRNVQSRFDLPPAKHLTFLIQSGAPPLPCSGKRSRERRPLPQLVYQNELVSFFMSHFKLCMKCICIYLCVSQCSASQYQFMPQKLQSEGCEINAVFGKHMNTSRCRRALTCA